MSTTQPPNKMELVLSTQTRCDGSATSRVHQSESVAGVFGPLESRFVEDKVDGVIEVSLKSLSSSSSQQQEDVEWSMLFKDALEACIKFVPRTTISLSVRILANEGSGLTSAMLSAVGALVDAGVPLLSIPIGVELVIDTKGEVFVDPSSLQQKRDARVTMFMVFADEKDEGPIVWISQGPCSEQELTKALSIGKSHASKLRSEVEDSILLFVNDNRDLCVL